jgi:hypothetical protein
MVRIMLLPDKPEMIVQTPASDQMTKELAPIAETAKKEELGRPSLTVTRAEGCEPPKKLEYEPKQPIEELCSAPPRTMGITDQ